MASPTPNEDVVLAMPLPPGLEARFAEPGLDGVSARMTAAIVRQINLAVARELDLGSATADVETGLARALGLAIAGYVIGARGNPDEPNLSETDPTGMVAAVSLAAIRTWIAFAQGQSEFTMVVVERRPR